MDTRKRTLPQQGFSLLESAIVVTVLALLVALMAPTLVEAMKAYRLSSAGEVVAGRILEAQGLALTFSSDVELRIYKSLDTTSDDPRDGQLLQILQLQETNSTDETTGESVSQVNFRPIGSVEPLPEQVAISTHAEFTTLWSLPAQKTQVDAQDRNYIAFRFRPDGSTSLAENQPWHLTLVDAAQKSAPTLPPNFATLQVDPVTGKLEVHRPE